MKPVLLALMFLSEEHIAQMAQTFEVIYAPDAPQAATAIAQHGSRVRVVLTIGAVGLSPAQIDALPSLTLICALGAGYENVAVAHAKARGIVVATGAGTNDDCVADHTWGLLIAAQRRILPLDKATRAGIWRTALPLPPNVSHKRLGIIGLGTIGKKIAQRALGFEIEVGYHNRSARTDVPYRYFADVTALAEWADFLVVATPGGAGTRHLVNADVLKALGARGVVVNIARGSVIDTTALAAALRDGRIAAAGLDVYESEPALRPSCWTWTTWYSRPMWQAGRPKPCRPRWTGSWRTPGAIWQVRRRSRRCDRFGVVQVDSASGICAVSY